MLKLDQYNDTIEIENGENKIILSISFITGEELDLEEVLELLKQELNNV